MQSKIENQVKAKLDQLTKIMMENYNLFHDELQSDMALSVVVCARILVGVHHDRESYRKLLQNLEFGKWQNKSIKQH